MRLTIPLLVILMLCAGNVYALGNNGLMLYLPFNEGSGNAARDASGNGNNGDIKGNFEWVEGQFGKAVHLHDVPDEYVEVPHSDTLDIRNAITLELWTKVDSMDQHCAFISKAESGQVGAYMLHISNNNGFYTALVIFIGVQGPWPPPAIGTTTIGEWHHFAGTYDGVELTIYIDGELQAKANRVLGGDIDHSDAPVVIGRDNRMEYLTSRTMDCTLDEVRIWNRVLSQAELKEAMAGKVVSVDPEDALASVWGGVKMEF